MPVETKHECYGERAAEWAMIRDVIAGSQAVKAKGQLYLPKPAGLSATEYSNEYVLRAEFHNATRRTVDGLAGAIFRREPQVTVDEKNRAVLEEITPEGDPLVILAKRTTREVISLGRAGLFVDAPEAGGDPYIAFYPAESVINWRVQMIAGEKKTTLVVLCEPLVMPKADDEFKTETSERYRVLRLVPDAAGNWVYSQQIYTKVKDPQTGKEAYAITEAMSPNRRGGKVVDYIPFVFIGPTSLDAHPEQSPILDLTETNLSHYRTSAEIEEGAHYTGLPMYVLMGDLVGNTDAPGTLTVGARTAIRIAAGGDAKVLSVNGDGMKLLTDLLAAKEKRMAILGARILEDQKTTPEAAATVMLRHRGENSLLANIADTVGRALTIALRWVLDWSASPDETARVELNKNFVESPMSAQEMVQLVAAWQQGGLGAEMMFQIMKERDVVPDGWTFDDWKTDVENNGASSLGLGMFAPQPGDLPVPPDAKGAPQGQANKQRMGGQLPPEPKP